MLFNSFEFLFGLLPASVLVYHLLLRSSFAWANASLLLASLIFYAWWNPAYLALMLASIAGNYAVAMLITRAAKDERRHWALIAGVVYNLGILCYFKYMDFFIGSINALVATDWPLWQVVLPIGVSFFTFTQIGFLIEVRRGREALPPLLNYALYVTFFPHLIAGPILKFSEVAALFDRRPRTTVPADLAIGLAIIALGLFKKVVVGDTMAQFANPAFAAAKEGVNLTFIEAWSAVLCFTVQIYCDFSGYSDMAIGLARLFGVKFPTNFYSPYQATSIIEFWRRWHMTLSRFLRDALYLPLGGSRKGKLRRDANLFATMGIAGLWHGANWTFVVWGAMHGLMLIINHRIRDRSSRHGSRANAEPLRITRIVGWVLTLLAVAFAWVWFRAETLSSAVSIFKGMLCFNGISLPAEYADKLGGLRAFIERLGISFVGTPFWNGRDTMQWLIPSLIGILLLPNVATIFRNVEGAIVPLPVDSRRSGPLRGVQRGLGALLSWRPSVFWLLAAALAITAALTMMLFEGVGAFIYFQF